MGHGLQVWDTPTPLDLQNCIFRPVPKAVRLRFYTINVNETSGILFHLTRLGNVIGIYPHYSKRPCADFRNGCIVDWTSSYHGVWIYVPLPRDDPLTQFGCVVRPHATMHSITAYFCCLVCLSLAAVKCWILTAQSSARLQLGKRLLGDITSAAKTGSLLVPNDQQP